MPNPYHDKSNGRFTTKTGGAMSGDGAAMRRAGAGRAGQQAGGRFGFTDASYREHQVFVERTLEGLAGKGRDSESLFRDRSTGEWQPQRHAAQEEIIAEMYGEAAGVPREGRAVVAGGLGGAGKGYVLSQYAGIDQSKYLTINPDDVKERLAARGMIPRVKGLSPMEASVLVHEEASDMAKRLAARAAADKRNVIWDITMSSPGSGASRVKALRDAGYGQVDGVFVDVDMSTSLDRAKKRHRRGEEAFRNGEGYGGRFLPTSVSLGNRATVSGPEAFRSRNAEAFSQVKGIFDSSVVYDNMGEKPRVTASTGSRWR